MHRGRNYAGENCRGCGDSISEDKDSFHTLFDSKDAIEADADRTFHRRELPEHKARRIAIGREVVAFGDIAD